jgi:GTP-binding protein
VADQPGLTRDRKYGIGKMGDSPYLVVDTGGIAADTDAIDDLMQQQVRRAIDEADHILFLLDAKEGVSAGDEAITEQLRRTGKPITPVVNKSEGLDTAIAGAEFYTLGLGEPVPIAAVHGHGVQGLINGVLKTLPKPEIDEAEDKESGTRIAVIGRPNVGKPVTVSLSHSSVTISPMS